MEEKVEADAVLSQLSVAGEGVLAVAERSISDMPDPNIVECGRDLPFVVVGALGVL